jgi:phosphoribosylformylglycinamidine synthase
MAELNWIPKCKFVKNDSKRFESRFSTVRINKTNAIMLKDLEYARLGIWVAHGEGKCEYQNLPDACKAISYIDAEGKNTEAYPMNPNGSKDGITGVCSENGRHLAMMPHPERCFLKWQAPYIQPRVEAKSVYYPWFKIFTNAYDWCKQFKK